MSELSTPIKLIIVLGIAAVAYFLISKSQTQPPSETESPSSSPSPTTPSPTTPAPTTGGIPDISGVWDVYDSTGTTNNNFTFTFANNTVKIPDSISSQFPLSNMTYTTSSNPSISGTYTNGSNIVLPLGYTTDKITVYAPNKNPLYILKPKPSPTTPSPTTPSPTTPSPTKSSSSPSSPSSSLPSASPSSSPTPSPSPTASPTDPPSTVKGRYIQILGNSQCLSFDNIKIYSTPYGNNIASTALVTSSTKENLSVPIPPSILVSEISGINNKSTNKFFKTSCFTAGNKNLNKDDPNPWIMIDLGKVVPIYKIVLKLTPYLPITSTGAVLSILDENKNPVFNGKPLTDISGKVPIKIDDVDNIKDNTTFKNYYSGFIFYPSLSTSWEGISPTNYLVGNWVSEDGKKSLIINSNSTLILNTLNGPVKTGTYNLVMPPFAGYTTLDTTPTPTPTISTSPLAVNSTTAPPFQVNIMWFGNFLMFNKLKYYANNFPGEIWTSNGTQVIFGPNMVVSGTNTGTYTLNNNDSGTMVIGNKSYPISTYLTSDEKRVVSIGDIDYYPNILVGTWLSIDKPSPMVCTFANDMSCVMDGKKCTYSSGKVSIPSTFDYTYTIYNSGNPIYYAASNRGMMFLYPITMVGNDVTSITINSMPGITLIKNPFIGKWSGNVIQDGKPTDKVVTWVIDNFTVTEPKGSSPAIQLGNYWIHGPNTKDGTSASLGKTYNLRYNQSRDQVGVFTTNGIVAILSRA